MRKRVLWIAGLVALAVAVGAVSVAVSEPVEARAAVEIEDVKVELELAMTEGLVTEGGACFVCFGHNCPWPGKCGFIGSTGCTCRTCGGSYNCFPKPGIANPR